jgi:hypothetical protein
VGQAGTVRECFMCDGHRPQVGRKRTKYGHIPNLARALPRLVGVKFKVGEPHSTRKCPSFPEGVSANDVKRPISHFGLPV